MVGRWSEATTLKFVYFYKLHECLWNTKSEQYSNKEARHAAYTNLVFQMGLQDFDVRAAKVKIKNLRAHYFTELKKVRNAQVMGHMYEPTLYWYKEMDCFLRDIIGDIPSLQQPEVITADSIYDSSCIYENGIGDFDEDSMGKASPIFHITPEPQVRGSAAKKNRGAANGTTQSTPRQRNRKRANQQDIFDEFEVFGKSVAAQLRKLSVIRALRAQTSIQAILTEERLHELESITSLPSETLVPSGSDPHGGVVSAGLLSQQPTTVSGGLLAPQPTGIGGGGLLIAQPPTRSLLSEDLIVPEPTVSGSLIAPESTVSENLIMPEPTITNVVGGVSFSPPKSTLSEATPKYKQAKPSSPEYKQAKPSPKCKKPRPSSPIYKQARPSSPIYKQAKPSRTSEIKPECDVITLDEDDPFEGH